MGLQTRHIVNSPWYDSFNLTAHQYWLPYYIILASLYNFTFNQNICFPIPFFICFFVHISAQAICPVLPPLPAPPARVERCTLSRFTAPPYA